MEATFFPAILVAAALACFVWQLRNRFLLYCKWSGAVSRRESRFMTCSFAGWSENIGRRTAYSQSFFPLSAKRISRIYTFSSLPSPGLR
ncbi:hypothetical protein [Cupriavidus sp. L7L]|uniref:hypothetical protein n=1 Tax=Cupriavidus sp. L7L TaxID=2546443 RepID=UPI001055A97E|nr:hypothetical protein [Cupriavidus sp. L7L]TDF65719.1 hypothetical protein E1J61_14385 [Cupriavidus sp. L7L]